MPPCHSWLPASSILQLLFRKAADFAIFKNQIRTPACLLLLAIAPQNIFACNFWHLLTLVGKLQYQTEQLPNRPSAPHTVFSSHSSATTNSRRPSAPLSRWPTTFLSNGAHFLTGTTPLSHSPNWPLPHCLHCTTVPLNNDPTSQYIQCITISNAPLTPYLHCQCHRCILDDERVINDEVEKISWPWSTGSMF